MKDLMIPEEYLLLRKEYLTTIMDKMPVVKLGRRGENQVLRVYENNGSYYNEISRKSRRWNQFYKMYTRRAQIENALKKTNQLLKRAGRSHCKFSFRVINRDNMFDSAYYDRLEDSSCSYEKTSSYYYNGRNYRSRAEMQFAYVLDEFGLEFKYDVEVTFNGKRFTVDFVVVFREFNRSIFIEYFGKCSDRDYIDDNNRKLLNAQLEGVYINRDLIIVSGDKNYTPGPDIIESQIASLISMLSRYHIEITKSDIVA